MNIIEHDMRLGNKRVSGGVICSICRKKYEWLKVQDADRGYYRAVCNRCLKKLTKGLPIINHF